MKVSKGQSQPEIVADIRLLNSLHGSGSTILLPGFEQVTQLGLPKKARPRPVHPGLSLLGADGRLPHGGGPSHRRREMDVGWVDVVAPKMGGRWVPLVKICVFVFNFKPGKPGWDCFLFLLFLLKGHLGS